MKSILLGLGLSIALTGCGVKMEVTKAKNISDKEICIVDNPAVQLAFRDAYERQIQAKGYATKIAKDINSCQTVSTYNAAYGMHWGVYLATANLKIFSGGQLIGEARYEAPYSSPQKHGKVEDKIKVMVAKLLP